MRFWFQRSEKEDGTAYVGAEHEGASGFLRLHAGGRELAHAASAAGMAYLLNRLRRRAREVKRAQKDARKRQKGMWKVKKDPRRSTGLDVKTLRRLRKGGKR